MRPRKKKEKKVTDETKVIRIGVDKLLTFIKITPFVLSLPSNSLEAYFYYSRYQDFAAVKFSKLHRES